MKLFIIIFSSIVLVVLLAGLIELKLLKVTEYNISDSNVPAALKGRKIALISDLHGVYHGRDNERLIKKLKETRPDYIVISGDVINGRKDRETYYAGKLLKKLKELNVPVIYTFGNHEEKLSLKVNGMKSYEELVSIAKGFTYLLNDDCYCPEDIEEVCFVGINLPLWLYHDHDRTGMLEKKVSDIMKEHNAEGRYTILVAHDPEHFEQYADSGVNLCLCGHLHGGIVRLPLLGGFITPRLQVFTKRTKGCFEKGKMKMIVSGGAGWHDFPIRIMNRPEIVTVYFA